MIGRGVDRALGLAHLRRDVTVPVPAGVVIVQLVLLAQTTPTAFFLPNLKIVVALPGAKPLPVTVTLVPPSTEPVAGATPSTTGVYLKWSLLVIALVPARLETVTSTMPPMLGGDTTVMLVADTTVNVLALAEPNFTPVTPVSSVPVIVTDVPPVLGPDLSDSLVIAGTAS